MPKDVNSLLKNIKVKEREKQKFQEQILGFDKKIVDLYKERNRLREKAMKLDEDIYLLHLDVDKQQEKKD